jgi:hypothetical protein
MQCDRAEEFFSDYLERTLDRPMTVALEAHLAACGRCRGDIEALQAVVGALEAVPEVEPPRDGAWKVMAALRSARAEQYEAERAKAPTFLEWLRALNPASAALGAGLATLVIGGTLFATGITGPHTTWSVGPTPRGSVELPAPVAQTPRVAAAYGALTPEGQVLHLQLTAGENIPDAVVRVTGGGQDFRQARALTAGAPLPIQLTAPSAGRGAEAIRITVHSPSSGRQYSYLVVMPLEDLRERPVTLIMAEQPLDVALGRLAPFLGRPVIVEGLPELPVSLQVSDLDARAALRLIADKSQASMSIETGGYYLRPL